MLRLTRGLLRKRTSRRHTPTAIAALPTPQVKRRWGDLSDLAATEREEILHGQWRQAEAVALAPDDADRDRGGFTEGTVTFTSEEAAEQFLQQESADDASENQIPALTLAQHFFTDLAVTADEELDMLQENKNTPESEGRGAMTPAEAREDERRDVQRHFFADYYTDHGLLGPQEDRFAFVNAVMTPAPALLEVNCERPLVRLTVRDQLEAHTQPTDRAHAVVFAPASDGDPLTFVVPSVPWQPYGAPLRAAYTAQTSFLALQEATAAAALEAGTGTATAASLGLKSGSTAPSHDDQDAALNTEADADALAAWLNEENDTSAVSLSPPVSETTRESRPVFSPPSLAHTQWLQRQVATDALVPVDVLGRVLALVAARWAYPAAATTEMETPSQAPLPPPLILDLFGMNGRQRSDAYRDIARLLYRFSAEAADVEFHDGSHPRLLPCVAVCVPSNGHGSPSTPTSAAAGAPSAQRARPRPGQTRASAEDVPGYGQRSDRTHTLDDILSVADQSPSILYVQSSPKRRQVGRKARHDRDGNAADNQFVNAFEGACDVVICTPVTSEDGRRPRTIFGDAAHVDDDTQGKAADDFIAVCTKARDGFPKLVRQLSLALQRYAKSGGLVLYATYSMNPLENEAVVAAAIQHVSTGGGCAVGCVPLRSDAEILNACGEDDRAVLAHLLSSNGQPGLADWAPVEGADPRHQAAASPPELRAAIASCAWRLRPDRDSCDGGFLIALSVRRTNEYSGDSETASFGSSSSSGYTLHLAAQPSSTAQTVHLLTQSCDWWWRAVSHSPNSYWTCASGGVAVGIHTTDAKASTAAQWALSSSLNNSDYGYVIEHYMHQHALAGVPSISVTVPLLYELLQRRSFGADLLHRFLLEASSPVASGSSSSPSSLTAAEPVTAGAVAVRALLEDLLRIMAHAEAAELPAADAHWRRLSVLCAPTPPPSRGSSAASGARDDDDDDVTVVPHEAVCAELQEVRIALSLRYRRRRVAPHEQTSSTAAVTADPSSVPPYPFDFVLELTVPRGMPGRDFHLAAMRERTVGLRDALLFLMRRCGWDSDTSFVLPADAVASPTDNDSIQNEEEEGIELAADEFEVDGESGPPAALLSFHEQATRQRRIGALEGRMRSAGLTEGQPTSWAASIHYGSARRSGRG